MHILCNRILHMLFLFLAKITYFYNISILIKKNIINYRGHPDLNRGPLDLQSNALPLSYIPDVNGTSKMVLSNLFIPLNVKFL